VSAKLLRTNLGKWGRTTQTYEEHVHAVWVFRKPLLAVVYAHLRDSLSRQGRSEDDIEGFWQNDYLPLAERETRWHDYDKLFVPQDRLGELSVFSWHGHPDDPANVAALAQVLQEDSEIAAGDRRVWSAVLRAANFAHEGLLTPDKAAAVRAGLASFGGQSGWPIRDTDYGALANIHVATLRAADAIASAQERPAFKDDVSRLTNIVAGLIPGSRLRIVAITFETAFSQSPVSGVLSGYYRFYDSAYKGLVTALSHCGHVVGDNARTLLGVALTAEPVEAMRKRWWSTTCAELGMALEADTFQDWCSFDATDIDLLSGPADFDATLRREMFTGLAKAHLAGLGERGFPCGSCGRRVVNRPLDEADSSLKDEVASPERRGDFGFAQDVRRYLFGLETRIDKSKLLVCAACDQLARLATPGPPQGILVMGGYKRKYERLSGTLELTSPVGDPLTRALLSFPQQQDVLARLANTVSLAGGESQRVAGSAVRVRFTGTLAGLLSAFVEPVLKAVETTETCLPDGSVYDELEFGLRVGPGALIMGGKLHDTVHLPGVYSPGAYRQRLQQARRLHEVLSKLAEAEYERALYSLRTERAVAAVARRLLSSEDDIAKILKGRKGPKLSMDEVLEIANLSAAAPSAVEDLQRFRVTESG